MESATTSLAVFAEDNNTKGMELQSKYEEARKNYMQCVEEKLQLQRNYVEMETKYRLELESKCHELSIANDQNLELKSRFDKIKADKQPDIQLRNELEILRKSILDKDDVISNLKREVMTKTLELKLQKEAWELSDEKHKIESDAIIGSFSSQVKTIQEHGKIEAVQDQNARLRIELAVSERTVDTLKEEISNLRAKAATKSHADFDMSSFAAQEAAKWRSKIAVAEAERQGSLRKLEICNLDYEKKEALLRSLKSKVDSYESEIQSLNVRIVDLTRKFSDERAGWDTAKQQLEDNLTEQAQQHSREMDRFQQRLEEREAMLRAAQVRCAESQLRAEEVQYDARRVESLALHSPSSPRSLRLDELNVSVTADAIHAEVEPLRREKQLLLERIRELQTSLDRDRALHELYKSEAAEAAKLNQSVVEAKSELSSPEPIIQALKQSLAASRHREDSLQKSVTKLQDEVNRSSQEALFLGEALRQASSTGMSINSSMAFSPTHNFGSPLSRSRSALASDHLQQRLFDHIDGPASTASPKFTLSKSSRDISLLEAEREKWAVDKKREIDTLRSEWELERRKERIRDRSEWEEERVRERARERNDWEDERRRERESYRLDAELEAKRTRAKDREDWERERDLERKQERTNAEKQIQKAINDTRDDCESEARRQRDRERDDWERERRRERARDRSDWEEEWRVRSLELFNQTQGNPYSPSMRSPGSIYSPNRIKVSVDPAAGDLES